MDFPGFVSSIFEPPPFVDRFYPLRERNASALVSILEAKYVFKWACVLDMTQLCDFFSFEYYRPLIQLDYKWGPHTNKTRAVMGILSYFEYKISDEYHIRVMGIIPYYECKISNEYRIFT